MTKQTKQFIFFASILVGFPLVAKITSSIARKKDLDSAFAGHIATLRLSDKMTAVITINNERYAISNASKYFKQSMAVGDSVVKLKNSKHYKLIKAQTGLVIDSYQQKAL